MVESSSASKRSRRPQLSMERDCVVDGANDPQKLSAAPPPARTAIIGFPSNSRHRRFFEPFVRCLRKILIGRTTNAKAHQRKSGAFFGTVRRTAAILCFIAVYFTVYHRLEATERQYDVGYEQQQQQQQQQNPEKSATASPETGGDSRASESQIISEAPPQQPPAIKGNGDNTLSHYLGLANVADTASASNPNPSLEEARKGRERIVSILEDAGIDEFDAQNVLRLPLWSSVSGLYYNKSNNSKHGSVEKNTEIGVGIDVVDANGNRGGTADDKHEENRDSKGGPIIHGLEGCSRFRERIPPMDRFLGVAGNFNSGTTAFGISLQKNCRFAEHLSSENFVVRKRRSVFASNVNGMLSQVPWAKHKMADYRDSNHTILPPTMDPIDHDRVLPVILVRDPFYWMQSMCKEGYGVRWDHDSNHHCPNLIPNEFDRRRFPKLAQGSLSLPVPVWMGANPTVGPTWPSLIHYWNAWYESYYYSYNFNNTYTKTRDGVGVDNDPSSSWPRLIIRFEDTLFYPEQVMEKVCHCGGGKLLSESSISMSTAIGSNDDSSITKTKKHDYTFEEAKPSHKHQQKNNFVTAMIEYGTNATRLRNMTDEDVKFAIETLNPTLMQAFGYSYPIPNTKHLQEK